MELLPPHFKPEHTSFAFLAFRTVGAAVHVQYLPADRQAKAAAALVALLLVGLEVAVPHVR